MSIRLLTGVFVVTTFIGGCAQTPTENSPPHSHHSSKSEMSHALETQGVAKSHSQQELIDEIMHESGMDEMIEQMPAMISAMMAQQPPPVMVKIEDHEKLQANIIKIFEPVKMRKIFTDYFNENYDAKRFPEFLALLKTPLAQEMTALELAAQTPEGQQEMMQAGDALMREASPQRLELVRQLDELMGGTEMMVDMQMMVVGIVQRSMNKIVPREHHVPEAQLEQSLEQGRMQAMLPARQFMQLNMVYGYRSVDDEKMNDYLELHQSETGRWATELFKGAMMKMSENMGAEMAQLMEQTFIETNAG